MPLIPSISLLVLRERVARAGIDLARGLEDVACSIRVGSPW